ncbi:MAG: hypothetical protein ACR2GK_13275 [Gemmatimonadaceae bacterium]
MIKKRYFRNAVIFACGATALACASNTIATDTDSAGATPGTSTGTNGQSRSQQSDWAAIEKLEGEAKARATTTGCTAAGDCRAAPVGSRACGGPRYYLPYCAKSTDSAALYQKLDQVAAAEHAYNKKYEIVSTCEFRMPPAVGVTGGACTEQ